MIEMGVLRAEWTKFSSIRATMVLSAATVVVSALFGWIFGGGAASEYAAASAQERLDFLPLEASMSGLYVAQLLVSALGVLVASTEYGSGTMRPSLAAVGGRGGLVAAKAVMTVLTALPVSVASVWVMYSVSQGILAASGTPYLIPGDPDALVFLLLGPVMFTLLALFGLALGLLLRGTAAAVNVSTAFLLLPVIGSNLSGFLDDLLTTYWPNTAGFAAVGGTSDLPVPSFGLFVGFVAVMLVAAFIRVKNSDA